MSRLLRCATLIFVAGLTACSPHTPTVPPDMTETTPRMSASSTVSFVIAGDVMVHGRQLRSAHDKKCDCYDFKPVFEPIHTLIRGADYAIANLETTLPGGNYSGYPSFGSPDSLLEALRETGFDILTTANNHILDRGKKGFLRTLKQIDKRRFTRLGAYRDNDEYEAHRILLIEKDGIRFALLNYTYGTNGIKTPEGVVVSRIDPATVSADIALARAKDADFVIVLYHFGTEYLREPDAFQKKMVRHALHEGADIIIGGHPHTVQPYEMRTLKDRYGVSKPRLVVWSLGNFVSNQRMRHSDGGMVFYFTIRKTRDAEGRITLSIEGVRHELVWVYVKKLRDRAQFYILPITRYLGNKGAVQMSKWAYGRMMRFYKDTTTHLADSVAGLARYQKSMVRK